MTIRFERPPPGASAEERAEAYADALMTTEKALNEFKEDLSQATEEILVLRNLLEKDRQELARDREERARNRVADKTRREEEKRDRDLQRESYERRFEHIESMLELIIRKLSLEAPTPAGGLPPMRDRAPSVRDEIEDAVERGVERAIERKTPTAAFQVPGWSPPPVGISRSDVRELVENKGVKDQRDALLANSNARADMYRNIVVGAAGLLAAGGIVWVIAQIIRVAAAGH